MILRSLVLFSALVAAVPLKAGSEPKPTDVPGSADPPPQTFGDKGPGPGDRPPEVYKQIALVHLRGVRVGGSHRRRPLAVHRTAVQGPSGGRLGNHSRGLESAFQHRQSRVTR